MKQIGFINLKGEVVIAPHEWNSVSVFNNGVAGVCAEGGKFGWINAKGEELIAPSYKIISSSSGYYAIEIERFKAGVVHNGKILIPCTNSEVDVRGCGDGMITVYDDKRLLGFCNLEGEKVIDNKFYSSEDLQGNDFTFFSEGLAPVALEEYGPVGFINKQGEMVIEPQYPCRKVRPFSEGLAWVGNGKYIDKQGATVLDLGQDYVNGGDFKNGFAPIAKFNKTRTKSKMGLIDLKGKEIIKCSYNEVEVEDGAYIATKGDTWKSQVNHIYSAEGKRIPGDYKTVLDVYQGVVIAQTDDKKLFIDTKTGQIYGEELDIKSIGRMREGLMFVITADFTGFVNSHADKVIDLSSVPELKSYEVGGFKNGYCSIINPSFIGFIDAKGDRVLDFIADNVLSKATAFGAFSDGLCSFTL